MAAITGTHKQFKRQRVLVGELEINGADFRAQPHNGNVYYVDSNNGSDSNTGDAVTGALATLDAAFAKTTANQGDVIFVLPNHAETITGAAGIAHDVAGVSVIGLGIGNQRPRFLMDASTAVTYAITAADAYIRNLVFAAGHADIVACITTTKSDTWIDECEFVENVATENFLTEIKATGGTANDNDGLKVTNCRVASVDASGVEFIETTEDIDRLEVSGNVVNKPAATSGAFIFCTTGKDLTNCRIVDNEFTCATTSGAFFAHSSTTANSGIIARNWVGHADTDAAAFIDVTGTRLFENYGVGVVDASALLVPDVDDNA